MKLLQCIQYGTNILNKVLSGSRSQAQIKLFSKTSLFRSEDERVLTNEDLKHQELTGGRVEKLHKLAEKEILFEAANSVRMGKDILYLISSSGNELEQNGFRAF